MTMTESKMTIESSKAAKLRIGVLCISMDPGSHAKLETAVAQTPGAHVVDNVDQQIVPREVTRMLEPFQYKICLVDFDEGIEESCRIAERFRDNCDPGINLFAASSDPNPEVIIAAMRAGCSEYLVKPFDSERVSHALAHIETRRHIKEEDANTGRVVAIVGSKGGTGVTTLALHLALNLTVRHNQKCLLVDQHPALGDASLYLGLPRHQYSFYELVYNTDRLDKELLQGYLMRHESGLHVLDSPDAIDTFAHASAQAIEHTLSFLADNYQFVIVDCPAGMTDDTSAAIRQSDKVAIVITPELPAIRNALRLVEYLVSMHYPDKDIEIVLNRHAKNSPLTDEEIEAALRRPIAIKVPNSYSEIVRAINSGTPVARARNANLPIAFDDWADRLMGGEAATPEKTNGSQGWWKLFRSRV